MYRRSGFLQEMGSERMLQRMPVPRDPRRYLLLPGPKNVLHHVGAHLQRLGADGLAVAVYFGILPTIAQITFEVIEADQASFP